MTSLDFALIAMCLAMAVVLAFKHKAQKRAEDRAALLHAEKAAEEIKRQADKRRAEIADEAQKAKAEIPGMTDEQLEAELNKP